MLPSADFEDGLKIYNNSMLCKHVGQSPALRPLSFTQPIYKIFKPEHVQGIPLQRFTIQRDRTLLSQNGQEILSTKIPKQKISYLNYNIFHQIYILFPLSIAGNISFFFLDRKINSRHTRRKILFETRGEFIWPQDVSISIGIKSLLHKNS